MAGNSPAPRDTEQSSTVCPHEEIDVQVEDDDNISVISRTAAGVVGYEQRRRRWGRQGARRALKEKSNSYLEEAKSRLAV